ncbi:MAG: guanylate kinase [Clostridia bacterium]|nr:guanylate kinase [Clostridia bacterium]
MSTDSRGLLIVFSGPSGSGKGTVLSELLAMRDDTVISVSVTTRAPRPGDVEGVHYFFRTHEQVEEMIKNDELLEYASYNGNYYGTPRAAVEQQLNDGKNVILEIEVQGAEKVMAKVPDHVSVFLAVPSMEELERRLRTRGTETEESVCNRMHAAEEELKHIDSYQHVVLNDDVKTAAARINALIEAEKHNHKNGGN